MRIDIIYLNTRIKVLKQTLYNIIRGTLKIKKNVIHF